MRSLHGYNGGGAFVLNFMRDDMDERSALDAYVKAMSRGSPLGDWVRSLEPMRLVRIHGQSILFVHGGIPYHITDRGDLKTYFDEFIARMSQSSQGLGGSRSKYSSDLTDRHSIFWDRRIPRVQKQEILDIADELEVDYIVIGHTPQSCIANYYDRAFNIDVGMTPAYGENEPAAVVFKHDGVYAFYARRGEKQLVEY